MKLLFLLVAVLYSAAVEACEQAKDPSRIAIAGGSITEILYFLGEESRIIATDLTSTFPDEAQSFPSVGYVRGLSAEGILSLKPTLVLGEQDMGPEEVVKQLQKTSIDIRKIPELQSANGITEKINCVASVIGKSIEAQAIIELELGPQLKSLRQIAEKDSTEGNFAILLMISEGSPIVAGLNTSGHHLLLMSGRHNAFTEFDGWKPVSLEAIAATNPDYIIIADRRRGANNVANSVKNNPAIRLTTAAKDDQIHMIDGMALLGFGPRTLDVALRLADL